MVSSKGCAHSLLVLEIQGASCASQCYLQGCVQLTGWAWTAAYATGLHACHPVCSRPCVWTCCFCAQGVLGEYEAATAMRCVMDALAALHAADVVFGDVKPSNFVRTKVCFPARALVHSILVSVYALGACAQLRLHKHIDSLRAQVGRRAHADLLLVHGAVLHARFVPAALPLNPAPA